MKLELNQYILRTSIVTFVATLALPTLTSAAQPSNQAVVLVSGLNSPTPFSTPTPGCAGKEGDVWGAYVAGRLKQQGFNVYTAPERKGSQQETACGGNPAKSTYIDATAGIDNNGQALGNFFNYLNQTFGVTQIQLVTHSYGGLWSRSAITQSNSYSQNLSITSLTSLGTPHTGSFAADILQGTSGLDCKGRPIIKAACDLLKQLAEADIKYLGPEAVSELTGSYVGSWNPNQQIASCPVTPIAGTYIDADRFIDRLVGPYYLPNDGLVGAGSAAATTAPSPFSAPVIPNLQAAADFEVVHSASLGFLSKNNLLNQPAIVSRILQALNTASAANCVQSPKPPQPTPTPPVPVNPVAPVSPHNGALPKPRRTDVIVKSLDSKVRCGGRLVKGRSLVQRKASYEVIVAPRCPSKLRVSGKVVMLRRKQGKKVTVRAIGDHLQIKVSDRKKHERVKVYAMPGNRWKKLKLKRGKAALPDTSPGDQSLPVKVETVTSKGKISYYSVLVVRLAG